MRTHILPLVMVLVAVCVVASNCAYIDDLMKFEGDLSWLALGDSYSSGEGTLAAVDHPGADRCQRGPAAYPYVAIAAVAPSVRFGDVKFLACTGATVREPSGAAGTPADERAFKTWPRQLAAIGADEKFDVITMTFGGDDVGFAPILTDCIWTAAKGYGRPFLDRDLVGLLIVNTSKGFCTIDKQGSERAIKGLKNDLTNMYRTAAQHLKPNGELYVLGYPRLFAASDTWGWAERNVFCNFIKPADADNISYLNGVLNTTVHEASKGAGSNVQFVDVEGQFQKQNGAVCGTGPDLLNGLSLDLNDVRCLPRANPIDGAKTCLAQFSPTFHPNDAGQAVIGQLLAEKVSKDFADRQGVT